MKLYLATLALALTACAGTPTCVVTHSPSVKVVDANGMVVSQLLSTTTEICPGSIEVKK